jgi:hypothetical protein
MSTTDCNVLGTAGTQQTDGSGEILIKVTKAFAQFPLGFSLDAGKLDLMS